MSNWHELGARLSAGEAIVAGVMSGTSVDGIDVAIARCGGAGTAAALRAALAFEVLPFEPRLHARVRALLERRDDGRSGLGELARLHRDLGSAFGAAALEVARRHGLALDLVASHGQTVWHHDGGAGGPATLQLGDGDCVSEAARCTAASDFRARDIAAGGQGAPLVALVERALFPRLELPGAVLNLGGIANVALFDARGALVLNLDTGPCGALLDGLARRLYDLPLDRDGERAARGRVDAALVEAWLAHPYFAAAPPKSTGRDTFGEAWLDGVLARAAGVRPEDVLASAVELVATHVACSLARFGPCAPRELVVAGGGVAHSGLLAALQRGVRARVVTSAAHGVDPKAREALAFALLGAHCALAFPLELPAATGARGARVLGKLSPWLGEERAR
jgi:anhydro-N-acetylmuramic acid kinase